MSLDPSEITERGLGDVDWDRAREAEEILQTMGFCSIKSLAVKKPRQDMPVWSR
jgi:hypothetical protein